MRFVRSAALLLGGSLFLGACGARTDSSEGFPGAGGSTGPSHDCCSPHSGPGCSDAGIQECVCGFDPACCTDRWSPRCALTVTFGECGVCEGDSGSGGRDPATGGRGNTGGYSTGGGQFVGSTRVGWRSVVRFSPPEDNRAAERVRAQEAALRTAAALAPRASEAATIRRP
jgi:hypothetical protein